MKHVIGVDVGGSKTLALLVNESGTVVARIRAGGANPRSMAREKAAANLREALGPLVSAGRLEAVCVGAAGLARESDREFFEAAVREVAGQSPKVLLRNDAQIALRAGASLRPAVVAIAGTGSIVYGERALGQGVRCGGYGALIEDVPSAYSIGLAAIRHAARALDGLEERGTLGDGVLQTVEAGSVPELVERIHHWPPEIGAIASLAALVWDASEAGDPAARHIVAKAYRALAEQVASVAGKVRTASALLVIASGGAFDAVPSLLEAVREGAKATGEASIQRPALEPAHGAAFIAMEAAGIIQTGL